MAKKNNPNPPKSGVGDNFVKVKGHVPSMRNPPPPPPKKK